MSNINFTLTRAENGKSLHITRYFAAPVNRVWDAWTKSEMLNQWWAPKPWWAETKKMDFRVGGLWLYCMCGPDGDRHWSRADFEAIQPKTCYIMNHTFCDENGNINPDMPETRWTIRFSDENETTKVNVEISCEKPEDLQAMIVMGIEEGFEMALGNLDGLL
jgi:PhnB protein